MADPFSDQGGSAVLSRRTLLSEEVNALAASLDIVTPAGNGNAYEPDAFLKAIHTMHDKLQEVKEKLLVQAREQKAKAAQLEEREAAVNFREKRVLAHEKLLALRQPERKSWLASFLRT